MQDESTLCYILDGSFTNQQPTILGVFDGIGGEAHGEIASLIAAAAASEIIPGGDLILLGVGITSP